jgi:DNA-binding LacI/PurR family transcriptional regulator
MKQRGRISDVAKLARVSPATVSAVVNNRVGESIRVSPETQKRVWDAVQELGYAANPVARSLAKGRNQLIGIFTYEAIFPIQRHDFFYPFLIGIEQEAEAQGYDLLLYTSANQDGKRSAYQGRVNKLQLADGAIFLGLNRNQQELAWLFEERFHFVTIGRREVPGHDLTYVGADYVSATAKLVSYLAAKGHKRIAYLRSTVDLEPFADRESGFRQGLQLAQIPEACSDIYRLEDSSLTGAQLGDWLANGITAFVAESDYIGNALLKSAKSIGRRSPRDFSMAVLGQPLSPFESLPEWTAFHIPRREMGARAVQLLIEMLNAEEETYPRSELLACSFEAGNTVGAPPRVSD